MKSSLIHVFDTIRPVTPDDYPEISSWAKARGLLGLRADLVAPQGFIAPGVACGFMITTNTSIGILDHFASNPEAPKAVRGQALERIAEMLIAAGQSHGMRAFLAFTSSDRIKRLCTMNGFKLMPQTEVWLRGS